MENYVPFILLILAALINALPLTSDLSQEETKKKVKKWVLVATLVLIAIATVFAFLDQDEKNEKERINYAKQLEILIKADSTLCGIKNSYSHIQSIQKKVNDQYVNQKALISSQSFLIQKNQQLLLSQQEVIDNTNRIIDPLFPMDLEMTFVIPFSENSEPNMDAFFKTERNRALDNPEYLSKNRCSFEVGGFTYTKSDSVDRFYISDADTILKGDVRSDLLNIATPMITFIKTTVPEPDMITYSMPQTAFLAFRKRKKSIVSDSEFQLTVDFLKKEYVVNVNYENFEWPYFPTNITPSSKMLSFDDLLNCYVMITPFAANSLNMKTLRFTTDKGISRHVEISFTKKDSFRSRNYLNRIISYHKIIRNDINEFEFN